MHGFIDGYLRDAAPQRRSLDAVNVYVGYQDFRNGVPHDHVAISRNNASPVNITQDQPAGTGTLSCGVINGGLRLAADRNNTSGFPEFSAHLARSTDHGATFADTVLQSYTTKVGTAGNPNERLFGDYQQLKAVGNTFYGAFIGNLNGLTQTTAQPTDTIFFSVPQVTRSTLTFSASTIGTTTTVSGSTGCVVVGDPADDGRTGNQLNGYLLLNDNHSGLEAIANHVTGSVQVQGTTGAGPFPEDTRAEIEGNTIGGTLSCSGNTPPPTNDGHPNTVTARVWDSAQRCSHTLRREGARPGGPRRGLLVEVIRCLTPW
ncbi:hypothetical protein [Kitasatospora mediocidica]|uniref:hypothetical protein n=1 Tax=Kitasatospora mediocidica TaxID=58352 RepID=UPI00056CB560|nr:hypothetical protein [Kitasatospora mediocidica]